MQVKIKKLHPNAKTPTYATDGSGCFDLYAATTEGQSLGGILLNPGSPLKCETGLAFEIPPGHVMLIFSRSGHGFKHGARLANCVGVIDSDYRGGVAVKLTCDEEENPVDLLLIAPGDRIAQAIILPFQQVQFLEVEELTDTARGANGFGSTGE